MNYYERHIGDYLKDTAHLSLLEHGVYCRLLDVYYTREAPLPSENIARLIGARSKDERKALQSVLGEFFELADGAYRQHRCDAEIARLQDKRRKASESAKARWSQAPAQTDGNANADADAMRTHSEGNARAPVPRLQTPDTIPSDASHPSVDVASKSPRPARKAPAGFLVDADMQRWAREKVPGLDIRAETEKFRDHTFKAAISDWPGAWRNWMRRAAEGGPGARASPPQLVAALTAPSLEADRTAEMLREREASRQMTPEQQAAAEAARRALIDRFGRRGKAAA